MRKGILSGYVARFLLSVALFSLFPFSSYCDEGLKISTVSGVVNSYTFTDAKKLVFVNETMSVVSLAGNVSDSYMLKDVNLISFSDDLVSSASENLKEVSLMVYPNPTESFLFVQGIEAGWVSVYSMVGSKVLEKRVTDTSCQIDVSSFAPGIYILTVNNKSFKFCKK